MDDPRWDLTQVEYERQHRYRVDRFHDAYLIDPTPRQLRALLKKHPDDGLRGLIVNGQIYWWHAHIGTHSDGMNWLGVDYDRDKVVQVELHAFRKENEYTYNTDVIYGTVRYGESLDDLLNHPTLAGHWNPEGDLMDDPV